MGECNISLLLSHISTNNSTQHIIVCVVCLLSQNTRLTSPHLSPLLTVEGRNVSLISFTMIVFVAQLCYKSDQGSGNFSPSKLRAVCSPVYNYNHTNCGNCYQACCLLLKPFFVYLSYPSFLMPRLPGESNAYLPTASDAWPAICLPSPSQITVSLILGSKQSRNQSYLDRSAVTSFELFPHFDIKYF